MNARRNVQKVTPLVIALNTNAYAIAERAAKIVEGVAVLARPRPVETFRQAYRAGRPIIAVCAAGIIMRALGPLLSDKWREPPVIVLSEDGRFVVPLLGGHRGANRLARQIAAGLTSTAVITTASDLHFDVAFDDPPLGWRLANPEDVKAFSTALLEGASVRLEGSAPWLATAHLPLDPQGSLRISVTARAISGDRRHLVYHPRVLMIGTGCARGAKPEALISFVRSVLSRKGLAEGAVAAIGTIDLKADEPAMHALSSAFEAPLRLFDRVALDQIAVPNPSDAVKTAVGTPSVAEAAALLLAGENGRLIVEKQIDETAQLTVAIAESPVPPTTLAGRTPGKVFVVGIGPGDPRQRTYAAEEALLCAKHWVGYELYLDLAADLAQGKKLHPFPIGAERARVRHALTLAAEGEDVALLCSGDAAIYAMASLVWETLENDAGLPEAVRGIGIEVIPGITALQMASARAGALIGHDFCAISLSDLLTPWPVIERRIQAAAQGDFVVAFYNPRSRRRTRQLEEALRIMREHRPPDTPVIIASNLGRSKEDIRVIPLKEADCSDVDMLSIILVGNSESRMVTHVGHAIAFTPRGYAGKMHDVRIGNKQDERV